jgi:hypothetical protein
MRRTSAPGAKPGRSREPPQTRRARINTQGRVTAPATMGMRAMCGVNAAIEVGKYKLDIALGSNGELFSTPNQVRAITRLAKRLAELAVRGC